MFGVAASKITYCVNKEVVFENTLQMLPQPLSASRTPPVKGSNADAFVITVQKFILTDAAIARTITPIWGPTN